MRRRPQERERATARRRLALLQARSVGDCSDHTAQERLTCPLLTQVELVAVADIPGGVRLRYRPSSISFERMQRMLGCQAAMARLEPEAPPLCRFFDARTSKRLRQEKARGPSRGR
jgi:hypothetical protein